MAKAYSEQTFRRWYAGHAKRLGISRDPDEPEHHYDYRRVYRKGLGPDKKGHWPSFAKTKRHPRRYLRSKAGFIQDTATGKVMLLHPETRRGRSVPEAQRLVLDRLRRKRRAAAATRRGGS